MSSMFEIPILYVACDVKIVKKRVSFFCSRELRKIQLQTCFHVLAGFFFRKKTFLEERRGAEWEGSRGEPRGGEPRETNRTESKLRIFI